MDHRRSSKTIHILLKRPKVLPCPPSPSDPHLGKTPVPHTQIMIIQVRSLKNLPRPYPQPKIPIQQPHFYSLLISQILRPSMIAFGKMVLIIDVKPGGNDQNVWVCHLEYFILKDKKTFAKQGGDQTRQKRISEQGHVEKTIHTCR